MSATPSPDQPRGPGWSAQIGVQAVLLALTVVTGLIDAVSYLGIGQVFVANMTGNVVFLGFASAGAGGFSIAASLVALAGFLIGAGAGARLAAAVGQHQRLWLCSTSAAQAVLVGAAAAAAGALGPVGPSRFGILVLLGIATGAQNAMARRLAVPDLTTTVLTLTLTGLAADSSLAGGSHPRRMRRVAAVVAMFVGALVGAVLLHSAGFTVTLAVVAVVFVLITLAFAGLVPDRVGPAASASS